MMVLVIKIIKFLQTNHNVKMRLYSSALYITGDKAQKHFSVLTPIIDFEAQLKQKGSLIKNIEARQLAIDLNKVEERWNFFKDVDGKKNLLEETRIEVGKTIANLLKLPATNANNLEIDKLKVHLRLVKEDLKNLRLMCYEVEEGAAIQVLGLPNSLHPKTPLKEQVEIYRYLDNVAVTTEDHVTIGSQSKLFKLMNYTTCYLEGNAALFEHAIQNYFNERLTDLNYTQFSNSDFVKSIIVEGCGTNPFDNTTVLTLENIHCVNSDELNQLHLVGASSLYSFMAYFCKHSVQTNHLPMKLFCVGRRYQIVEKKQVTNLFNLNQTSEIGLFVASLEQQDCLEAILNDVILLYKQLGCHFKVVLVPANQLKKAESLRLSVQMFSNYLQEYVEVGAISFYQDYISKRLLFNYSVNKERKYPYVAGGSLLNIHRVIGCLLENNSIKGKPLLSDFLQKYVLF